MLEEYPQIEKCPLFKGLNIEEIDNILTGIHHQIKKYNTDQLVVNSGQSVDRLLIVLSGSVKGEMIDFSGKTIKIEDIEAPQPLATAFMFGKENTYPVNIVTNTASEILVIPKESVLKLFQVNQKILLNFLNSISNRSQFLSQKIRFLNFQTIKGKIANYLLQLSEGKEGTVVLEKSQNEMAELFGVTRPSVGRGIRDLHKEGIIQANGKNIKIINIELLKACLR